jgi:hypothetical protein
MIEFDDLLKRIEELREEMYKTLDKYSDLKNSHMIEISRKLDIYLVEYHKLLRDMSK